MTAAEGFESTTGGGAGGPDRRVQLMPELFAHLNPMPFDAAVQMEKDLAEDLRNEGFTVVGGR